MSPEEIKHHFLKIKAEGDMIQVPTDVPGYDFAFADHPSLLALADLPIEVIQEALRDLPQTSRFLCPMARPGYDHRQCREHELPRLRDEDRPRALSPDYTERICYVVAFFTSNFCPNAARDAGLI